jgi:DNA-binding transcriptional MerR regulator
MEKALPAIPAKRYFTIGEVADLCRVKPYVLRYWEQEFTQLKPMKRRGNRRYYQHHEVLLIRRIRDLLYEQGFTISGARNQLTDLVAEAHDGHDGHDVPTPVEPRAKVALSAPKASELSSHQLRDELLALRDLLAS